MVSMKRTIAASHLLVVLTTWTAAAAPSLAQRCFAAKMKAAGKKISAKMACVATATRLGAVVDADCLTRAEAKFAAAYAKAGAACWGVPSVIEARVDVCVATLAADVPGSGSCPATKAQAVGKAGRQQLGCTANDAGHPGTFAACYAKSATNLAAALGGTGGCPDGGTIQPDLDACRAQITAVPIPTTTSTTTTTSTVPPPVCGNGVVEGSEECDIVATAACMGAELEACAPPGGPQECTCCTVGQCQFDLGPQLPCCPGYRCSQVSPPVPHLEAVCVKECTQQADCPPTESCLNGECAPYPPCSQPADCTPPATCLDCPASFCTPPVSFCCAPPDAPCPSVGVRCCFGDCNLATGACP
jgi:hypothetical protein